MLYIYVCGISKIWFSQLFQFQPFNTGVYDLFWVGPTNQQTGVEGQYNTTRKLILHVSWRRHFLILRNIGWIKLNLWMPHNSPCLKIHYWEPWEWWVVPKSSTDHTTRTSGLTNSLTIEGSTIFFIHHEPSLFARDRYIPMYKYQNPSTSKYDKSN